MFASGSTNLYALEHRRSEDSQEAALEPDERTRADQITRLLRTASAAEPQRAEQLLPLVYEELRALARSHARRDKNHTIQGTALVHEAYLRLIGDEDPGWNSRGHFFGAAAQAMRRILVEQARSKARLKRGGDRQRVPLDEGHAVVEPPNHDVLALDDAVRKLEQQDARKAEIVNLRYFAGFTAEETAAALDVSLGTIEREWRFIKAWLKEELDRA